MERTGHVPINRDNIGYVDMYDFSKANMSGESRVKAVTTVASICYQSDKKIGSQDLYDRLRGESIGLPSSSFEFVPILLTTAYIDKLGSLRDHVGIDRYDIMDIERFGELVYDEGKTYLLTNLRALLSTIEHISRLCTTDTMKQHINAFIDIYNTEDECSIIRNHFYVFKYKVDLNTRSQMVRHRMASWQELSRRYVSGKKIPFEFYKKPSLNSVGAETNLMQAGVCDVFITHHDIYNESVALYNEAVKAVPAQDARRLIPQAMYTELWGAWMPRGIQNFLSLRLDKHAQAEIQEVAEAMDWYIRKDSFNL